MKKTFALLFAAVAGLLSVQIAQATPYDAPVALTPAKNSAPKTKRAVHYITSVQATGSHLPLVVSSYGGQYHSQSPSAVYGKPGLDRTGQLGVFGELYQRDPAITVGRH